ncbi:MAG: hypothetical protein GF317_08355 [Candidatus Lokiarchaeota archaeon]|nr:hypothetical protein [Candidatus Lokiarchaeota archaeon]MBD3199723.1 hypothetical protein [Candidatus Lokiarchaeota archaeon]
MVTIMEDYNLLNKKSNGWGGRPSNNIHINKFMDTLEFTLNNAIDACVAALTFVRNNVPSLYCEDCITGEELTVKTIKRIAIGIFLPMGLLSAMAQLGMWALNSALILQKLEESVININI